MELGAVVLPVVAAVEFALAALLLWAGGLRARPILAAVILVANGLEAVVQVTRDLADMDAALYSTVISYGFLGLEGGIPQHRTNVFLDTIIAMSVAMLLAWTPRSPRHPKVLWWLSGGFGALLLVWVLVPHLVTRQMGIEQNLIYQWLRWVAEWVPWLLAASVLLFRSWPGIRSSPSGPARAQGLLVITGLAVPMIWQFGLGTTGRTISMLSGEPGPNTWDAMIGRHAAPAVTYWFLAVCTATVVWHAMRRKDLRLPGAAMGFVLVASVARVFASNVGLAFPWNTQELLSQFVRPAFLAVAFLPPDLSRLPRWAGQPVGVLAAVLASSGAVVLAVAAATPGGLAATEIGIFPAAVAVVLVLVVGAFVGRPAARVFREAMAGDRRERLDRYRLALEREDAHLDGLRRELGLSREEAAAVEAVLAGRLLVPESAVRGLRPGDCLGGRFHVVGALGAGGEGRVVCARDAMTGGEVVLKAVHEAWAADARRRLERLHEEARAGAARGRRSEVITLDGMSYLVRDHVPGPALDEVLATRRLTPGEWNRLGRELVAGVEALHRAGVVHGDIKPANIILGPDGAVLIDEGAASGITRVMGTANWAAPEQWRGPDERTDIYQLARVMEAARPEGAALPRPWRQALHQDPGRRPALARLVLPA